VRCATCGMRIRGRPIREEADGAVLHYCCVDCLLEEVCRRDRALRRAFRKGTKSSVREDSPRAVGHSHP